jgi:O-antigen biosynthesis alpha-1,3-abequosyltransferase
MPTRTSLISPRLSICIPTYNFGRFIGETLESIVSQATEEVEIVVLDGASTDNTTEVVEHYRDSFSRLHYYRQDFKGGIDRDMAKSVELARGEYCWLFSADDVMAEGALDRILRKIRSRLDLYLCGFTRCSIDMKPVAKHQILRFTSDVEFDLGIPADRMSYFSRAMTTTAFFSYMSSLVLRKDRWDSAGADDSFMGSCWGHVARIFRMIPAGLKVGFLPEDYLLNRGDNDSFLETGRVNRIAIAVDGYHRLGEVFFGEDSVEAYHMRRVLKNEYAMNYLLYSKLLIREGGDKREQEKLESLVDKLYFDRSPTDRLRHAVYRLSPVFLLHVAAAASRRLRSLTR